MSSCSRHTGRIRAGPSSCRRNDGRGGTMVPAIPATYPDRPLRGRVGPPEPPAVGGPRGPAGAPSIGPPEPKTRLFGVFWPPPGDPRGPKKRPKMAIFCPLRRKDQGEWGGSAHSPDPTAQSAPARRPPVARVLRRGAGAARGRRRPGVPSGVWSAALGLSIGCPAGA